MSATRVSNSIPAMPNSPLPLVYSADGTAPGTASAIPTVTPTALSRSTDPNLAMGKVSDFNVVSFMLTTGGNVSLWLFSDIIGRWVHGGSNSTEYTKAVDALAVASFVALAGTPFLLTSDTPSVNGYV